MCVTFIFSLVDMKGFPPKPCSSRLVTVAGVLGAAAPSLGMQCIYGGLVFSCPGLTSIRE